MTAAELHTRHSGPLVLIVNSFADQTVIVWTSFALAVTDAVNYTTVTLSTSHCNFRMWSLNPQLTKMGSFVISMWILRQNLKHGHNLATNNNNTIQYHYTTQSNELFSDQAEYGIGCALHYLEEQK